MELIRKLQTCKIKVLLIISTLKMDDRELHQWGTVSRTGCAFKELRLNNKNKNKNTVE